MDITLTFAGLTDTQAKRLLAVASELSTSSSAGSFDALRPDPKTKIKAPIPPLAASHDDDDEDDRGEPITPQRRPVEADVPRRGRPPKVRVEAAPVAVEDDLAELDELADDDLEEAEEVPARKGAQVKTSAKVLDIDRDIMPAVHAFVEVHGRPAVAEIVNKRYKVKSVRQIPADKLPDFLKALKVG